MKVVVDVGVEGSVDVAVGLDRGKLAGKINCLQNNRQRGTRFVECLEVSVVADCLFGSHQALHM